MFSERPKNSEDSVKTLFNEASRRAHDEGMFDIDENIPTMEKDLGMMWTEMDRSFR
jgi:hypothetical protein